MRLLQQNLNTPYLSRLASHALVHEISLELIKKIKIFQLNKTHCYEQETFSTCD